MNKSFAGRYPIDDKMFWGKIVPMIKTLPPIINIIPLNLGYSMVLIISTAITAMMISARSIRNMPERKNDPSTKAVIGIGSPTNLSPPGTSLEFASTLKDRKSVV